MKRKEILFDENTEVHFEEKQTSKFQIRKRQKMQPPHMTLKAVQELLSKFASFLSFSWRWNFKNRYK